MLCTKKAHLKADSWLFHLQNPSEETDQTTVLQFLGDFKKLKDSLSLRPVDGQLLLCTSWIAAYQSTPLFYVSEISTLLNHLLLCRTYNFPRYHTNMVSWSTQERPLPRPEVVQLYGVAVNNGLLTAHTAITIECLGISPSKGFSDFVFFFGFKWQPEKSGSPPDEHTLNPNKRLGSDQNEIPNERTASFGGRSAFRSGGRDLVCIEPESG